jgi:hypothetical protein
LPQSNGPVNNWCSYKLANPSDRSRCIRQHGAIARRGMAGDGSCSLGHFCATHDDTAIRMSDVAGNTNEHKLIPTQVHSNRFSRPDLHWPFRAGQNLPPWLSSGQF